MQSAQQMVDAYVAAELAVLAGKSYQFNGRTWTREDLADIRAGRREWERRLVLEGRQSSGKRQSYSVASF